MKNRFWRYQPLAFFASVYLLYLGVLFFQCQLSDAGSIRHNAVRVIEPLFELGLFALVCSMFMRLARRHARLLWLGAGLLVAAIAYAVYLAQIASLYISNNFISVLALRNAESAGFVTSPKLAAAGLVALAWFGLFAYRFVRASSPLATGGLFLNVGSRRWVGVAFGVLVVLNGWIFSLQAKASNLEAAFWQVPASNLARNLYVARSGIDEVAEIAAVKPKPAGEGRCLARRPAIDWKSDYPFQKDVVYSEPLPFPSIPLPKAAEPNVIVIFAEGTSARLIGAYGGHYPGLTPNMDRLASRSMVVTDYFNHTAATYRGLIGQITSGYSFAGGGGKTGWEAGANKSSLAAIKRQTLPDIVRKYGYDSYFFSPHHAARPFTSMLRSLGFDEVFTYESIGDGLLDGKYVARENTGALEDQSLFAGIVQFLKQRETGHDGRPFFLATYNIGTHAFIDINEEGDVAYKDGSKPFLNKTHNYDAALGKFLEYFFSSPYVRNTVLVFTADHSAYPEPMFREVAGKDLKPYFVDRIPLMIFDPTHKLPSTYDAQGRNSLDLAPTTLQLLGMQAPNSFLGESIFEPRSFPLSVAALGNSYFLTVPGGVYAKNEVPQPLRTQFDCEVNVIRDFYKAEKNNRIFAAPNTGVVSATRQDAGVTR